MQLRKNEVFHKSLNNEYHVGSSVEICELWLKFWFENDWYFCNITKLILLSQDGFRSDCPEKKF